MGTKGTCHLGELPASRARPSGSYTGPHNDPYLAEQKALIDSVRSGKPINSGYHMANSTLVGRDGPDGLLHRASRSPGSEVAKSNFQFGPAPEASSFDTHAADACPTRPATTRCPCRASRRLDGRA